MLVVNMGLKPDMSKFKTKILGQLPNVGGWKCVRRVVCITGCTVH